MVRVGDIEAGLAQPTRSPIEKYDDTEYSVHAIHMVRSSMLVHMQLSQMADQKASLLLGATFIVFSVAVGQATNGNYHVSLLLLALSAFVSAMFAVAAVVPKLAKEPPEGSRLNLMFFGVFSHLSEDEYIDRMMKYCETDGRVLGTMLRDIHQNGLVLQNKKYKFLSYAFRTFQFGMSITFVVFLIESWDALTQVI